MSKSDERYNAKLYRWVRAMNIEVKSKTDPFLPLHYAPVLSTPGNVKTKKGEEQDRHATFFIDNSLPQKHDIRSLLQKMCDSHPKRKSSDHIYINLVQLYDHANKETNTSELRAMCITGSYCKVEKGCFDYYYYPIKGAFSVSIENVSLVIDKIVGVIKAKSYQPYYQGSAVYPANVRSNKRKNYRLTTCNLSFELNASSTDNKASASKNTFFEHRYKAWVQNLHILPIMTKQGFIFNTTKAIDLTDSIRQHVQSGGEIRLFLEEKNFKNGCFLKRYFLNDLYQIDHDALEPNIDKRRKDGLLTPMGNSKFKASLARQIAQFCIGNPTATAQDVKSEFIGKSYNLTTSHASANDAIARLMNRATIDTKKGTVTLAPKSEESQDNNPTLFERLCGCAFFNTSNNRQNNNRQITPRSSERMLILPEPSPDTTLIAAHPITSLENNPAKISEDNLLLSAPPCVTIQEATPSTSDDACLPLQHEGTATAAVVTHLTPAFANKGGINKTTIQTLAEPFLSISTTKSPSLYRKKSDAADSGLPKSGAHSSSVSMAVSDSTTRSPSLYRKKSDAADSGLPKSGAHSSSVSMAVSDSTASALSLICLDDVIQNTKLTNASRSSDLSAESILDPTPPRTVSSTGFVR